MAKRSLFFTFFGPQVLILLASMGAVAWYAWQAGWVAHRDERVHAMYAQADLVARLVLLPDGTPKPAAEIAAICHAVHVDEGVRVTVLSPTGDVLAESDTDRATMQSHADRREFVDALHTGRGWSERYSATLHSRLLYAARAIRHEGRLVAVVRVAAPLAAVRDAVAAANRNTLLLILITGLAAAGLSTLFALRVVRPVAEMRADVARIGSGDLEHRLAVPALPPLAELAGTINATTVRLREQVRALVEERNLRERILESMSEGVLAIDARQRIVGLNDATVRLLGLDGQDVVGRPAYEAVRRADFHALLDAVAETNDPVEQELRGASEAALWARATALRNAAGERAGTLVVLSDLSRIRRLERVRQEFVANVSHELRTPITSIIGFVETLLDGAYREPEVAERFLRIVQRQGAQMQSLLQDLLVLSRLDSQLGGSIEKAYVPLAGIIGNAVEVCRARADTGHVDVTVALPDGLHVWAHAGLLEQALANLVDNAIKYGGGGGRVEVTAERMAGGEVHLSVRDYGPGITPEHLDRLFERFYRIDKGRSREQGGTGLGLSIVKHIALVHGGNATVTSEIGKGSIFSIWLPGRPTAVC
jgi:two-component system phosphate regulon sensor histidine kinase PhoR